jgi:hypothetical protein
VLKITTYCKAFNGQAFLNGKLCLDASADSFKEMIDELVRKYKITHPRFGKMDSLSQLGFTVADLVLQGTRLAEIHEPYKLGVVLSNSSSSLDTDLKYQESTTGIPSPSLFVYTLPNIVLAEICIKNNFKGENCFFVSEKPDFKLLYMIISEMLDSNRLDACLGGWVEVLDEKYEAFIFLAEHGLDDPTREFTEENIRNIYNATPLWNS